MGDQRKAPLYEALVRRYFQREASFHVPGHKFGAGLEEAGSLFLKAVMGIDYTEIQGLDDLHHPEGIILEAQQLAAECFGAEETMFLVGGSTVGNMAMLGAACSRGDVAIVQRNVHKSVIHGLMLAGAQAVFLTPEVDAKTGIPTGVRAGTIERALHHYPQAKAVFVTNPNYYGMGIHLRPIAEAAHSHGIPLLVDEAHGAHFGFHPELPPSAMQCGADAVVQSTHKMLTAMTMGAMLHVQGSLIDREQLKRRLAMLQSSSPSYPILASLDLSRRLVHTGGERRIGRALVLLKEFYDRMTGLESIEVSKVSNVSNVSNVGQANRACDYRDPFKIVVEAGGGDWSGFQLQEALAKHGCVAEMADERHVLLACSLATGKADLERLQTALESLDSVQSGQGMNSGPAVDQARLIHADPVKTGGHTYADPIGEPVPMDWDVRHTAAACTRMPIEETTGCIAAESVIPYPPGIPLLYPGEPVRPEIADEIRRLWKAGARFQGMRQDEGCSILVVKTSGAESSRV